MRLKCNWVASSLQQLSGLTFAKAQAEVAGLLSGPASLGRPWAGWSLATDDAAVLVLQSAKAIAELHSPAPTLSSADTMWPADCGVLWQ